MATPPVQPVEYLRTTKPPSRRAHAPAQESKSSYQGAFIILPSLVAAGRGHVSRAACLAVSLSSLSLSLGTGRPRCALVLAARPLVFAALPQAAAVHTRRQAEAKEGMLVFEDSPGASGDPGHVARDTGVAAPGEPLAAQGNRRNERQMSAEERQEARRQVVYSSYSARHPFTHTHTHLSFL